ncbi:hypothetical protein FIBSPDRAFT_969378 [Athelia psychrophila]|uniref:Uncharacterized protein n=1 Tax=Athelia psychrophila TaxID=1759441 RepID=A0A167TKF3_9AGAM|nr:hypothetical protein FIBSPDRAFT_969378 [Fibularhizoctonia sp. CBS 109695]
MTRRSASAPAYEAGFSSATAVTCKNCCGCANWQDVFNSTLVPSSTIKCNNTSPAWAEIVQPTLQYIKEGCPNCYTFPYDDMSSTFTCKTIVDNYNVQNYTVELFNCPL